MNVLGFDTATPVTAVGLLSDLGEQFEARDAPAPGERGHHAERLLVQSCELLVAARLAWTELQVIAVGVGPGGYTGLRIGLATAHGLALAHDAQLVGVPTLRALAEPVREVTAIAVLDARRGELFVGAYLDDVEVLSPCVISPPELARALGGVGRRGALAIGDGALAQRDLLSHIGIEVPAEDSPLHQLHGGAICRLAAASLGTPATPLYLRRPDAERNLEAKR
ncbi:MAG TPA: tRNA (adenosine(37)-N6)-threonylcarbamoyltransferase complex dimerization subunit type 1 TsaB [Solirubrobacteraceae bacterium]|nr:tRNA (adenosine(37)-N6)-threonylcarbamoyltransferase complex dimerization subunit type 1 TsaB [Solirubrobacteraceae bacterium]